jgi:hypothetical protein
MHTNGSFNIYLILLLLWFSALRQIRDVKIAIVFYLGPASSLQDILDFLLASLATLSSVFRLRSFQSPFPTILFWEWVSTTVAQPVHFDVFWSLWTYFCLSKLSLRFLCYSYALSNWLSIPSSIPTYQMLPDSTSSSNNFQVSEPYSITLQIKLLTILFFSSKLSFPFSSLTPLIESLLSFGKGKYKWKRQ